MVDWYKKPHISQFAIIITDQWLQILAIALLHDWSTSRLHRKELVIMYCCLHVYLLLATVIIAGVCTQYICWYGNIMYLHFPLLLAKCDGAEHSKGNNCLYVFSSLLFCDPILENPTYSAKCCFKLFVILGWLVTGILSILSFVDNHLWAFIWWIF